ncbi:hypothetical protein P154DRAFT_520556, partial [Amniculicola lignicola CBS 123094]
MHPSHHGIQLTYMPCEFLLGIIPSLEIRRENWTLSCYCKLWMRDQTSIIVNILAVPRLNYFKIGSIYLMIPMDNVASLSLTV